MSNSRSALVPAPQLATSHVVRLDALGFDDKACSSFAADYDEPTAAKVPLSYLLGFELRWCRGGRFDGVYLQPAAAAVVASAPPCELAVRSALHRARSIAAQLEGRSLPRSGANAPPRRVRYFPTDRLRLLFGCEAFSRGYNCTEGRVPPDVCPHGAPPLLIHSTFAAHAAWPALRCLRLIPNLNQITGGAAEMSRVARTAAEGRSWGEREAAMVWVGTVKLPQRELFYSRRAHSSRTCLRGSNTLPTLHTPSLCPRKPSLELTPPSFPRCDGDVAQDGLQTRRIAPPHARGCARPSGWTSPPPREITSTSSTLAATAAPRGRRSLGNSPAVPSSSKQRACAAAARTNLPSLDTR